MSESMDQMMVVRLLMLSRVAPYHLTKKGMTEYPKKLNPTKPI